MAYPRSGGGNLWLHLQRVPPCYFLEISIGANPVDVSRTSRRDVQRVIDRKLKQPNPDAPHEVKNVRRMLSSAEKCG